MGRTWCLSDLQQVLKAVAEAAANLANEHWHIKTVFLRNDVAVCQSSNLHIPNILLICCWCVRPAAVSAGLLQVVDLGCGYGGTAVYVAQQLNCKAVGVNISPFQVQLLHAYRHQHVLDSHSHLHATRQPLAVGSCNTFNPRSNPVLERPPACLLYSAQSSN
jgi:SAM-dependent methyltransferase